MPKEFIADEDVRNMRQNIEKEVISKSRYPTTSGPTLIPDKIGCNSKINNKEEMSVSRLENGFLSGINLIDRNMVYLNSDQKTIPYYNEHINLSTQNVLKSNPLYNSLLTKGHDIFDDNEVDDLINKRIGKSGLD